jgi:hypothetical protein
MAGRFMVFFALLGTLLSVPVPANAQDLGHDTQTSTSCQIGAIKKGATGAHCDVPIPPACKVATIVATKTHWCLIQISAGFSCGFDP